MKRAFESGFVGHCVGESTARFCGKLGAPKVRGSFLAAVQPNKALQPTRNATDVLGITQASARALRSAELGR